MQASNILVTGASGFLGTHLVKKLTERPNTRVVSIIRDSRTDDWTKQALLESTKVSIDLSNPFAQQMLTRVIDQYDITKVYHLAGQTIVSKSQINPPETYRTNILGTVHLLEACRGRNIEQIIMMSTDKIYGEGHGAKIHSKFQAMDPYSTSKVCIEHICDDYRRFGLNIMMVRCCNIIGYDPYNQTRIVPATLIRLASGIPPIIHDSKHQRQYIYVGDVVKILMDDYPEWLWMNIGSESILSTRGMIEKICALVGTKIRPTVYPADFDEIQQQSMTFKRHLDEYIPIDKMLTLTINKFRLHGWTI